MGCNSSQQASLPRNDTPQPFLATSSSSSASLESVEGDLERGPTLLDDHNPTSKRSRLFGAIKSGAKGGAGLGAGLVHSGSSLVQRGGGAILKGGTNILSVADPRKLVGQKNESGNYLPVEDADGRDVEAMSAAESDESKHRWKSICAWLWFALIWAACMSASLFLFKIGVMEAFFGTKPSYCILALVASPVLIPIIKALLPVFNAVMNSLKGTKCYMWMMVIAMWGFLAWVLVVLWDLGIMQVVIGVISAQAIMVIIIVLLIIPCLAYALPKIKDFIFGIPPKVKAKLWEIPPAILPMLENMISGLLSQMEARILAKLAAMPKDVAKAVTCVGSGAVDVGKKGFGKARSGLKRMTTKSSQGSSSSDAGYQSE